MEQFIPLSVPNFNGNEEKYVMEAIKEGWVSSNGEQIIQFEVNLSNYLNTKSVIACQSGTSGIHLSLIESGVKANDYVIVPTLTFIATVNPVKYLLANPIFMDCDDSLCLDPIKLERFCKEECEIYKDNLIYKKDRRIIRAIIIVHVFGNLANLESIMPIAKKYNLAVIEDAAEALGSKYTSGYYAGKYAGTVGDYGVYSFNGNKIITTGGGGAVVSNNEKALKHIRYLSTQAKDDSLNYIHNEIGYNYRMTNLQAALGIAQLEQLNEFIKRKEKNYYIYKEGFRNSKDCKILSFHCNCKPNYWFYSLFIKSKTTLSINEIILSLQKKGIQTRPLWGLIHKQKPYKNDIAYGIEKSCFYSNCIINLPCSTNLQRNEIDYVINQILSLF